MIDRWVIAVLVGSDLYLLSRFVDPPGDLFRGGFRYFLVGTLLVLIFVHNRVSGRMTVHYVNAGETEKLQRLRKKTRWVAFSNLVLMVAITLISVRF